MEKISGELTESADGLEGKGLRKWEIKNDSHVSNRQTVVHFSGMENAGEETGSGWDKSKMLFCI